MLNRMVLFWRCGSQPSMANQLPPAPPLVPLEHVQWLYFRNSNCTTPELKARAQAHRALLNKPGVEAFSQWGWAIFAPSALPHPWLLVPGVCTWLHPCGAGPSSPKWVKVHNTACGLAVEWLACVVGPWGSGACHLCKVSPTCPPSDWCAMQSDWLGCMPGGSGGHAQHVAMQRSGLHVWVGHGTVLQCTCAR